ncbi:TetR/AcrR family transcriptional regulator [Flavobacterium silvisoli]|uniref:TetR/AcrR family transcriptional regulator n=1 Tax=Flavobacterium silvisoli TaxID=2529433 RepID=A0A4Q9Z250_9FLAO|nr:TetR family transcriptional regulator C-terminal domain-containing protein [Flavobacterium silvisoli]TBX70383.1 TetR/AcrR family transcriptional regulator [Flavobacterium silvisoli]
MATTKNPKVKKKQQDDLQIISLYMNDVLEMHEEPKNAFVFCKKHGIEESDFYSFFGSLDALKQDIWVKFFENAVAAIEKEPDFTTYTDKNKLLTLYFTLFEILTLNRSYVLFSFQDNKEGLRNLKSLKKFRNHFKDYIANQIKTKPSEVFQKVAKITDTVYAEGAWIQFLFLLKFWIDDTSKGFEKTDVLIEKSVNTAVDLLDTQPLESLFDLGKFLWKEKMQ